MNWEQAFRVADRFAKTPPGRVMLRLLGHRKKSLLEMLFPPSQYNSQTTAILRRHLHQNSNTVDVGAYRGMVIRQACELAPSGTHFAFEPLSREFVQLQCEFGQKEGVKLFRAALAETGGEADFHILEDARGFSGLRVRRYPPGLAPPITRRVMTATLDSIIPEGLKIDFMKIDVEGGEIGVLQGGIQTLRRSRPIVIFEHGVEAALEYGKNSQEIWEILHESCGLQISLMSRFLAGKPPLSEKAFIRETLTAHHYMFVAYPGNGV